MFLLDFLRNLRGYVRFSVTGDFVERFLNLCVRDGIPVWGSRRLDGAYSGCTMANRYADMRKHAKTTGVRIQVTEKSGLPFFRRRYRRRSGLLIGLGIFFSFLFIMSLFIWRIEVSGNEDMPESRIIEALEGLGIEPGTLRRSIDVRASERRALLAMPELSWIALNIDGGTVYVVVDERTLPPEVVDPHDPCNIIAAKSGQIIDIDLYDGQSVVREGDSVVAGDVLISGITQDREQQNRFRHARARIIARVEHTIVVEVPLTQTRYVETGKQQNRNYLEIFGLQIPLFLPLRIPHPYHIERSNEPFHLFPAELPISLHKDRYILMRETEVTLTEEEARRMAIQRILSIEKVELGDAEILERTAAATLSKTHFTATVNYIVNMDIAYTQKILISE